MGEEPSGWWEKSSQAIFLRPSAYLQLWGRLLRRKCSSGKWKPEVVLSYSFWKSHFGCDPHVIGRTIRLNTYPFTIVGVTSSTFLDVHQGQTPDLRVPVLPPREEIPEIGLLGADQDFGLIARLAAGVSRTQAEAVAARQLDDFVGASTASRGRYTRYGGLRLRSGERGWTELAAGYEDSVLMLFLLVLAAL